ncbi:MAG: hypothetical protein WD069_22090 [Planctomycetales bacterium]
MAEQSDRSTGGGSGAGWWGGAGGAVIVILIVLKIFGRGYRAYERSESERPAHGRAAAPRELSREELDALSGQFSAQPNSAESLEQPGLSQQSDEDAERMRAALKAGEILRGERPAPRTDTNNGDAP